MRLPCSRPGRPTTLLVPFLLLSLSGGVPAAAGAVEDRPRGASPDSLPEIVEGEMGRRMDELVRRAVPFGFAGQVLVEMNGRPVLHRAYGFADPRRRRPVTTGTVFGVASISKQLAAAAVLRLVEDGRLALEDPLPAFFEAVPADKQAITVRHLLTHTSGVRSAYPEDFEPASRSDLVRGILDTPPAFEPGTDWRYSTAGYGLVAAIVEEVTGRPYATALRELVFGPARMTRTGLLSEDRWTEEEVARARVGWSDRGSPPEWPRNWRNFGGGDVVSTAADLWRWDRALRAGRIFAPETLERYLSPLFRREGRPTYGFGLFFHEPPDGLRLIEHGGDAALGYNGSYYRYPDEGFLVLITCAARTPEGGYLRHALGEGLEAIARGEEAELPPAASLPSPEDRARLVGSYVLDGVGDPAAGRPEARLHLVTDGAVLWLAADGQAAVDLLEGWDEEGREVRARASRRTRALLEGLRGGDSTAYHRALGEEGRPHFPAYWSEWRRLRESRGPLHRFRVSGSSPGRGGDVVTLARLEFRGGTTDMTFFWSESARGRLHGTFVHPVPYRPPSALALGRAPDGALVAHALLGGRTLRVEVIDGAVAGLRILPPGGGAGVLAIRVGAGGWAPPF